MHQNTTPSLIQIFTCFFLDIMRTNAGLFLVEPSGTNLMKPESKYSNLYTKKQI